MWTKHRELLVTLQYVYLAVAIGAVAVLLCLSHGLAAAVCLLEAAALILVLIAYRARLNRSIRRVTDTIARLNSGAYDINLDEMVEGELAILQSQLYKTAVLLREQAQNATQDKENVKRALSDISHQLKTPITAISVMVDDLTDDPDMERCVQEDFLRNIRRELVHVNFLIQSILKLSRFEVNAVEFHPQEISAKELADAAIGDVAVLSDLKNVTIRVTGDQACRLRCDPRWQREALANILKNCIEHSKNQDGDIEIAILQNELYTKFTITDNGSGIPHEELSHVFERFYRGTGAAVDAAGIGLSLSRSIVEQEGGRISVNSTQQGTRFTLKYFSINA